MMSELMKRFFALLLVMTITIGMMPVSATANDVSQEQLTASEIPADSVDTEETEVDESEETADTQTLEDDLLIEDEGVGYALEGRAVGDTIYVLAGGDFQAGDNGQADHYYSRINMGNILDKILEKYTTMNGFLFVGDYDGDTHNDTNAANGITCLTDTVC